MDSMRVAVIGVGAVGGYFGGRLAQAGHDVFFVARGGTLEALRSGGLRVKSIAGDFEIRRPNLAADPGEIGPVDVVLTAVKAWQVSAIAPSLAPLIGPQTVVVPLQNGLEAPGLLGAVLGTEVVLGGLCKIFASKTGPAAIEHIGLEPVIEFGELHGELRGEKTERVERVRAAFAAATGMSTVVPDDIEAAMWMKLMQVEALGAVGAVARQPAGIVRAVPETRQMLLSAMEEVVAVGLKRGVRLDANLPGKAMRRVDDLPAGATASMHRDIAAGLPSEFEFQVGTVVRYGREAGTPTPVQSAIYAALLPSELLARGQLKAPAD
ncbi:MAG: 2-dehydropantoate 2-reductase [Acidobacteria bacterium]|nr:2-dehydropantoate 2-reductase [Acidobacteriota bacterium]